MKPRLYVWFPLMVAVAGVAAVRADGTPVSTVWAVDFTLPGDNVQAVITLGAEVGTSGYYQIVSITGTSEHGALSLDTTSFMNLDSVDTDNLFDPTGVLGPNPGPLPPGDMPFVDTGGFGYWEGNPTTPGNTPYAFYWNAVATQYQGCWNNGGCNEMASPLPLPEIPTDLTFTPIPEPSSMLLVVVGSGALGTLAFIRRKLGRSRARPS